MKFLFVVFLLAFIFNSEAGYSIGDSIRIKSVEQQGFVEGRVWQIERIDGDNFRLTRIISMYPLQKVDKFMTRNQLDVGFDWGNMEWANVTKVTKSVAKGFSESMNVIKDVITSPFEYIRKALPVKLCPKSDQYLTLNPISYNIVVDRAERSWDLPVVIPKSSIIKMFPAPGLFSRRCFFKVQYIESGKNIFEDLLLESHHTDILESDLQLTSVSIIPLPPLLVNDQITMESPRASCQIIAMRRGLTKLKCGDNRLKVRKTETLNRLYRAGKITVNQEATVANVVNEIVNPEPINTSCEISDGTEQSECSQLEWESKQCHGNNLPALYYEKNLPDNVEDSKYANGSDELKLLQCVQNSLTNASRGQYHNPPCGETPQAIKKGNRYRPQVINPTKRPCVTKELTSSLTDQYSKAMKCLHLDPKEMFPLINQISHFGLNAMGSSGELSVGQITRPTYNGLRRKLAKAYKKANKPLKPNSDIKRPTIFLKNILDKSTKINDTIAANECDELMEMGMEGVVVSKRSNESDRLCGKHNPLREFLLTGVLYIESQTKAKKLVKKIQDSGKRSKIKVLLSRWMHNGGPYIIQHRFRQFSKIYNFEKNTVENFKTKFTEYIAKTLPKDFKNQDTAKKVLGGSLDLSKVRARVRTIATFVQNIDNGLTPINNADLDCGE